MLAAHLRADAAKFLKLLLEQCDGADVHSWRTCRRCLALSELQNRAPLAQRFLEEAIRSLERSA